MVSDRLIGAETGRRELKLVLLDLYISFHVQISTVFRNTHSTINEEAIRMKSTLLDYEIPEFGVKKVTECT